jgi:hypothetical protein
MQIRISIKKTKENESDHYIDTDTDTDTDTNTNTDSEYEESKDIYEDLIKALNEINDLLKIQIDKKTAENFKLRVENDKLRGVL